MSEMEEGSLSEPLSSHSPLQLNILLLLSLLVALGFRIACGVSVVALWLTNPTRNHEVSGSVPSLAQWVRDPVLP